MITSTSIIWPLTTGALGVVFGAFMASIVVISRTSSTIESIEEFRLPILVAVTNRQLDVMVDRIWRLENILLEDPPKLIKSLPTSEEIIEAKQKYKDETVKLIRDYIDISVKQLECQPLFGTDEK